jgi:hypothetical protein
MLASTSVGRDENVNRSRPNVQRSLGKVLRYNGVKLLA